MKCPLRNIKVTLASTQQNIYTRDCLQYECAFWDGPNDRCSVSGICAELVGLNHNLEKIINAVRKSRA